MEQEQNKNDTWDLSKKAFTRHGIFLEAMFHMNGKTMKEIVEFSKKLTKKNTGIHYTALPAIINDFEDKGFIRRVHELDKKDKKKVCLFLTPLGLETVDYIKKASEKLREVQPEPPKTKKEIIIVHVKSIKEKWRDKCGKRRTNTASKE